MSNVTYVTIKMLIERGQEVKALSQINMTAKKKGFLMPFTSYTEGIPGFEGATVLSPDVGIYNVVTTVDFEGLYPSIIRAHNLCFTSIVLSPEYLNLPGVEYITVQFSPEESPAVFVQNTETVLPTLLVELYNERKKYKKLMKEAKTEALKAVYDRTQLAVKVSANSIYGILGSKTLGCRAIAASVTYFGREMIKQTKNYIETHHHSVYPEGFTTNILDENEDIVIKERNVERQVKVIDLKNIKDCYIKTNSGWRKIKGIEECS
jgi:DNA polymerase delta subunit 1